MIQKHFCIILQKLGKHLGTSYGIYYNTYTAAIFGDIFRKGHNVIISAFSDRNSFVRSVIA